MMINFRCRDFKMERDETEDLRGKNQLAEPVTDSRTLTLLAIGVIASECYARAGLLTERHAGRS